MSIQICFICDESEKYVFLVPLRPLGSIKWGETDLYVHYTAVPSHLKMVTKWTLCKWGHFERAKLTFKMLPASWSFNTANIGFFGPRAAKLPSVKVWEWFDPGQSWTWVEHAYKYFGRKGRSGFRPPTLTASNFGAYIHSIKRFKPFKEVYQKPRG